MRAAAALLGGLVGALIGFAAGAFGAYLVMGLLGVSDFEGERAVTAFLLFGPVGGVAGIALGTWLALRLTGGEAPGPAVLRWGGVTIAALAALGAAALGIAWLSADRPINPNGAAPRLAFEIRVPADSGFPENGSGARIRLDTDLNQMPAEVAAPRRDGEWLVLTGEVELYYRTARRLLVLDLGDGRQEVFDPRLPASPSASADWGPWRRVDYIFTTPDQQEAAPPGPADRSEMRSRVETF
jgi:hypothetical protein